MLRYPERVFIKFGWLRVPHVERCDGNQMAGIPPAFMGAKNRAVTLIGGINTHSNGSVIYFCFQELLRTYLEFGQVSS